VELRALCNEVPRTPPGPEGSNGTGNASGAADHPKFLAPNKLFCFFDLQLQALDLFLFPQLKTFLNRGDVRDSRLWKKGNELSSHCAEVAAANF
jgi:hypothetical protein